MKIRITAKQQEVEEAIEKIEKLFSVDEVSNFYPNRGNTKFGRVYLECSSKITH